MSTTSQRKRAPRQSPEERRAAILSAAREIFERDGYAAAKVADIAAAVGVVEGTVFHYYPSKRDLVTRVMEDFYSSITERVDAGLSLVTGTRAQLLFLIKTHLTVMSENAALCSVILNSSRDADRSLSADIRQLNRDYTQGIVEILKAGIASGELRADTSIPLVRNTVYGSIEHAMWVQLANQQVIDVDETAGQLANMVYRGICSAEANQTTHGEVAKLVAKLDKLVNQTEP